METKKSLKTDLPFLSLAKDACMIWTYLNCTFWIKNNDKGKEIKKRKRWSWWISEEIKGREVNMRSLNGGLSASQS